MEPDRLTAEHLSRTEAATPASGASDATHLALTFENNRLASELFGQFDQNLALIEQKLKIDARAPWQHGQPAR
jgi:phosphate starvation-inducible PhoH-like protein